MENLPYYFTVAGADERNPDIFFHEPFAKDFTYSVATMEDAEEQVKRAFASRPSWTRIIITKRNPTARRIAHRTVIVRTINRNAQEEME